MLPLSLNSEDHIPTKADIFDLQSAMSELPQAEGLVTTHHFSDGMYLRKLFQPQDTLIVGKTHKSAHFFLCAMGEVAVSSGDGKWQTLKAGDVLESKPGAKRITYAITDVIYINIHKTDLTDVDEIENELIEPDDLALFDSNNKLKNPALDAEKRAELWLG